MVYDALSIRSPDTRNATHTHIHLNKTHTYRYSVAFVTSGILSAFVLNSQWSARQFIRDHFLDRFYWLFFLFGLPRPLINPTNSKGYINVDNQFLYVSSQSLEKKI
ncbi:hypothetical protein F7725_001082 [Dissostichus mawsoni]|uniref:Uncharacterized protein n=1 Tax=Dissostichus mawsoni TaxID=36200 RepID=A0A7J5ZJF0_DISMA|nr:hypothetical protein F7725_001082 [Dissostichus mawsoni]